MTARVATAFASAHADLLRYLRAVVGEGLAEDVASQVWIEVMTGAPSFRGEEGALRRWVFATARRRALDQRRRWWNRSVVLCAPGDRALERLEAGESPSADRDAAVARIARLPRAQAEVILLRVLGGFSADEVAGMTGRSPGSVRVIQHRALRRLADDLARDTPDDL